MQTLVWSHLWASGGGEKRMGCIKSSEASGSILKSPEAFWNMDLILTLVHCVPEWLFSPMNVFAHRFKNQSSQFVSSDEGSHATQSCMCPHFVIARQKAWSPQFTGRGRLQDRGGFYIHSLEVLELLQMQPITMWRLHATWCYIHQMCWLLNCTKVLLIFLLRGCL